MNTKQKSNKGLKRGWICFIHTIKKATSYQRVKHRLGYRFYNDEFLQARLNAKPEELEEIL
jgi:hypothetical protein